MAATAITLQVFLGALFDGVEGFLDVRTLPPVTHELFQIGDQDRLEALIRSHRRDRNCYFGVAARLTDHDGTLTNCGSLPALFIDLDFQDSHAGTVGVIAEPEARARLAVCPLPVSILVHSGGGLQAYWLLKESTDLQQDAAAAKIWLRRLALYFHADLQAAEPARILRLPNTWNLKYTPKRRVTIEVFEPDRRYNLVNDFDAWLPDDVRERQSATPSTMPDRIPSGTRNSTLTSLGGTMRKRGMQLNEIMAALSVVNERCDPPLDDVEVQAIAKSVSQYTPEIDLSAVGSTIREFTAPSEGRYVLSLLPPGLQFDVDRLRRVHNELTGELTVRCDLPDARTVDGVLLSADFNFSSARARTERAKLLADRARTKDTLDWLGLLDEFVQRVIAADRAGHPARLLRELARPGPDEVCAIDGLSLFRRHPVIIFADGGSLKSYLALYCAGHLEQRCVPTLYVDWELSGEDHRERLERLFGPEMPNVRYVRCDRPLVHERDRLQRIIADNQIEYCIFDSVAYACDGPPEAAEVAMAYFRAVRQLGCGSLHLAHITKSDGDANEHKPFGSAFWSNSARSTWFLKRSEESDEHAITIALYNRKTNMGPRSPALGFEFQFTDDRVVLARTDLAAVADLSLKLPLKLQISHALRHGPRTVVELASTCQAKPDSLAKALVRDEGKTFSRLINNPDGVHRWSLLDRRPDHA